MRAKTAPSLRRLSSKKKETILSGEEIMCWNSHAKPAHLGPFNLEPVYSINFCTSPLLQSNGDHYIRTNKYQVPI